MKRFGWEGVYEGATIIGLKHGMAAISLEPGGQFELSGAPLKTIHETCAEVNTHLERVREVATELNLGFLGLGFHPTATREQTPVMPKGRYNIMRAYMPKVGGYGLDMMLRTCTVQVNLDFADEADHGEEAARRVCAAAGRDGVVRQFAVPRGRPNGFLSYRSQVWTDTDNARSDMLPFVFEEGFGFERYVDYALDVPMYFVYRDGKYIDASGQSFRDFLDGKLPALPGEKPTLSDWADHLTTIFPEVRLKKYRDARRRGGPWKSLCALRSDLGRHPLQFHRARRRVGPGEGLDTGRARGAAPCRAGAGPEDAVPQPRLKHYAAHMVEIASAGLKSRAAMDGGGASEDGFLQTLRIILDRNETRADEMLRKYRSEWSGDVSRVFADYAY